MFVTKQNMENAVSTVSKQLDHVHEALAVSGWLDIVFVFKLETSLCLNAIL